MNISNIHLKIFSNSSVTPLTNKLTQRDNYNRIPKTERIFFKKCYFDIFNECHKIPEIQLGDPTIQTKLTTKHN